MSINWTYERGIGYMKTKNLYYANVTVEVQAVIQVLADSEEQAAERFNEGAWHGVLNTYWDHAKVKLVENIIKGPHVN